MKVLIHPENGPGYIIEVDNHEQAFQCAARDFNARYTTDSDRIAEHEAWEADEARAMAHE